MQQHQFNIRLNYDLYIKAKSKCKNEFGIGLGPLIKIFLKSFVTQKGIGFYVGDDDLRKLFRNWLHKKQMEQWRKGCAPLPGPRLKDLYEL